MQRHTLYGILLMLVLILGISIFFFRHFTPPSSVARADIFINSSALVASFEGNEKLADSLYLYKVLSVTGVATRILKREEGNYIITLGEQSPGRAAVDCSMDTVYNHQFLSIKNGDSVTLRGTCVGRLTNVTLMQCIIEK